MILRDFSLQSFNSTDIVILTLRLFFLKPSTFGTFTRTSILYLIRWEFLACFDRTFAPVSFCIIVERRSPESVVMSLARLSNQIAITTRWWAGIQRASITSGCKSKPSFFVSSRLNDPEISQMGSCEAVLLSCRLLKVISTLFNTHLKLHINHVGVALLAPCSLDYLHNSRTIWFGWYCIKEASDRETSRRSPLSNRLCQ